MPRVSVIIPHLNTPTMLIRCLASVIAQRLDRGFAEIVVADNGSRTSLNEVRAAFPDVQFVVEPMPGPGPARNLGASVARGRVLAFIDADCRAEEGWLQAAVDAVERDPTRIVAGGDVRIDFVDPSQLTDIEAYEAVFAFRQRWYIERQRFSGTGNLAMGASVLAAVGPFSGIEVAEDRDWGRRATALGYPARYVDAMRIYHPSRTDFTELTQKWRRHISHDLHEHRAAGRSALAWRLRSIAVLGSALVHAPRFFRSDRLSGIANRWRGVTVLLRIRAWRFAEMHRAAVPERGDAASAWNRST